MAWLLIKFSAARTEVDTISDALELSGAVAVTIEAQSDEERFQSALEAAPLWNDNRVIGLFREDTETEHVLAAVHESIGARRPHELLRLEDADWGRVWMKQYRPIEITPRLWICPSWCEPPDPRAINLMLDPGLAFGTGTHPTTALCLRWLAEQPLDERVVLDYGCGSGILAIAALKLGAEEAIGTDIDPQALRVSSENAERNGVGHALRLHPPDQVDPALVADIVVANILAEPLLSLADEIIARVKPGGLLALSGLLVNQVEEIKRRYASHFELELQQRDGWALLASTRLN